jgi:hypothetical protein
VATSKKPKFEVLPVGVARNKYGLYAENRAVLTLNPKNVPKSLRQLIPLAQRWGESDDIIREDIVKKSSKKERKALKQAIADNKDLLEEWLAGPKAAGPTFSKEYIAFSAMVMAADTLD